MGNIKNKLIPMHIASLALTAFACGPQHVKVSVDSLKDL
jgi:hypothetical protein